MLHHDQPDTVAALIDGFFGEVDARAAVAR
jgi:hypothetical protein